MRLGLQHLLIASPPWCVFTHPIDLMGIHLLHCANGNKNICSSQHFCRHCVRNWLSCGMRTITCISFNNVQLFSFINPYCAHQRWIHTLTNVVIGDPTCTDLFLWSCTTQKFIASNVIQVKERNYCNQHPVNQFFLSLTIEIVRCFHKHANVLLCDYANAIWSFKRLKSPPFFVLVKKIQLHAKDANILHFKSNNNDRFKYFPTSTLSKHTLHRHYQPITSDQLLKWWNLTSSLCYLDFHYILLYFKYLCTFS
jgi:hypothetical protein